MFTFQIIIFSASSNGEKIVEKEKVRAYSYHVIPGLHFFGFNYYFLLFVSLSNLLFHTCCIYSQFESVFFYLFTR